MKWKALWLKEAQTPKQLPTRFLCAVFHTVNFLFFLFLLTFSLSYLPLKALSCGLDFWPFWYLDQFPLQHRNLQTSQWEVLLFVLVAVSFYSLVFIVPAPKNPTFLIPASLSSLLLFPRLNYMSRNEDSWFGTMFWFLRSS